MIDRYEEYVTDDRYGLVSNITDRYTVDHPTPRVVYESVMLHHYVRNEIADEPRDHATDPLKTFSETWNSGRGNCEEKSILLCSLLRGLSGHRTRFVTVDNGRLEGHALLEIAYTGFDDPERVARLVRVAHEFVEEIDREASDIHWETDGGDHWFVLDPVKSEYVGDVARHVEEGYVHRREDGTWNWHRVKARGNGLAPESDRPDPPA